MTRNEITSVVDLVHAAWSVNQRPEERTRTIRAWWRYLQDLDYGDVLSVIDRLVVRSSFAPRVGEVRRLVLDTVAPSDAPTVHEAWAQASDRWRAVETGLAWNDCHPLVLEAMRHAGNKPDEKAFRAVYERVLTDHNEERLMPAHPEPYGANE